MVNTRARDAKHRLKGKGEANSGGGAAARPEGQGKRTRRDDRLQRRVGDASAAQKRGNAGQRADASARRCSRSPFVSAELIWRMRVLLPSRRPVASLSGFAASLKSLKSLKSL